MDELKKLLENAGMDEAVADWAQQTEFNVEDKSGNSYSLEFEDRGGEETMFVQANGITVAMATVGGAGSMNAKVKDPNALLDAIYAFANNNSR